MNVLTRSFLSKFTPLHIRVTSLMVMVFFIYIFLPFSFIRRKMSACKLVFLNYFRKIISFVYLLITYAKNMNNHYQKIKQYQQNILSAYSKDSTSIKKPMKSAT